MYTHSCTAPVCCAPHCCMHIHSHMIHQRSLQLRPASCSRHIPWRTQSVACAAVKRLPGDVNTAASVELCDNVIWLRGIAWGIARESVQDALGSHHPPASSVLVPEAKSKQEGQQGHKGYAFLAYESPQAAQEARPSLEVLPLAPEGKKLQATAAPAALLPPGWPQKASGGQLDPNELQARRQKLKRQRARRLEQRVEKLEAILSAIPPPGGLSALTEQPTSLWLQPGEGIVQGSGSGAAQAPTQHLVDWAGMPAACQVTVASHGGDWAALSSSDMDEADVELDTDLKQLPLRVLRKRAQVESFAAALRVLLNLRSPAALEHQHHQVMQVAEAPGWRAHVVEFGSGSGNLVLPLAWSFPDCHFHAVDYKAQSVQRLQQRAAESGLTNLTASVGLIQDYQGPLDVALALHACGSATDYAMLQAAAARAAYIISPCCIGKLQLQTQGPQVFDAYQLVAQAADVSHGESHSHLGAARRAKHLVELDRNVSMEEQGYQTILTKLLRPQLHQFKSDLLLGAPKEHIGSKYGFPHSVE